MDDDDWTGTPPEGHHARDPEREAFWRDQWRKGGSIGAGILMAILLIVLLLAL